MTLRTIVLKDATIPEVVMTAFVTLGFCSSLMDKTVQVHMFTYLLTEASSSVCHV